MVNPVLETLGRLFVVLFSAGSAATIAVAQGYPSSGVDFITVFLVVWAIFPVIEKKEAVIVKPVKKVKA